MYKTYRLLFILLTCTQLANAQYSGGTGRGDIVVEKTNTKLGNTFVISGSWDNAANWSALSQPSSNEKVYIAADCALESAKTISGIEVLTGTSFTIENSGQLSVTGDYLVINPGADLTVDGTLNFAGTIRLQSSAIGTGSLIQNNSNVQASVERYIQAADWAIWDDGWHFVSSPVANQLIADEWITTGSGNGFNMYLWHEATNDWISFKHTGDFESFNNGTTFNPGQGYLTAYQTTSTKSFDGALNVSDINISNLTYTAGKTWPGFHLLGNPFSSALTWDASWTKTNLGNTAKIWNENNRSYTDINYGDIIPIGNGFKVEVGAGLTGNITIPLSSRTHEHTTSFYKNSLPKIKLIASDADGQSSQETIIQIDENASQAYDFPFDSRFIKGFAPGLYSYIDGKKLSTNTLNKITNETIIPIGFDSNGKNNYLIKLIDGAVIQDAIYLDDLQEGVSQDLKKYPEYYFQSSTEENTGRFQLRFGAVGILPHTNEGIKGFVTNKNELKLINLSEPVHFMLYDMEGRLVLSENTTENGSYFTTLSFKPGIYLLKAEGRTINYSNKITIH